MTDDSVERLLGRAGHDLGCEGAFELLDRYCEIVHRGEKVGPEFAGFTTHLRNCLACREDTEGLLATLERLDREGTK